MDVGLEAKELNESIKASGCVFWDFLSLQGKMAYFPFNGILGQSVSSKGTKINATIGVGLDDSQEMLCLPSISSKIDLAKQLVFGYSSSFGVSELRNAWKKEMLSKNPSLGEESCISLPIITGGLTHALSVVNYLFGDIGGDLLLFDYYWKNYNLIFDDKTFVEIPTFVSSKDDVFVFNLEGMYKELSSRDSAIILLNFPNNPSGYSLTQVEQNLLVEKLLDLAMAGKKLLVICDDAYFGLFYGKDVASESLFSRLIDLHENIAVVKVDGPTKEEFVWGLRVGCLTFGGKGISSDALLALESKAAGVIRKTVSNVSTIGQHLILSSLKDESHEPEKNANFVILQERYEVCRSWFDDNKELYRDYFTVLPFNSGYFLCLKLVETIDCMEVRQRLIDEKSVAVIALPFNNLLRIAFSSVPTNDLSKVFEAIVEICSSM